MGGDQTGSVHIIVVGLGRREGWIRSACRPLHWPLEFHLRKNEYMMFDFEESRVQKNASESVTWLSHVLLWARG